MFPRKTGGKPCKWIFLILKTRIIPWPVYRYPPYSHAGVDRQNELEYRTETGIQCFIPKEKLGYWIEKKTGQRLIDFQNYRII